MSKFSQSVKGFFTGVWNAVKGFFMHWNKPSEGHFVPSKEVVAYSAGGIGVQFIAAIAGQVSMASTCLLLGSIYGIRPTYLALIATINSIVTIVMQPLKSYLIDNTPGKQGKARPWLLWLSIPSAVLLSAFAYLNPNWDEKVMVIVVGVLFIIMNFVYQFYFGQYTMLAYLISPNTQERANIISISSLVYSIAPTITGALFPLIAMGFDDGQLDQNFYRLIFPLFTALGVVITLIAYFGTKERIIVPRSYKQKVKFWDAMKKIVRNKYLWILNITGWFQFARAGVTGVLTWVYIYMLQNEGIQSAMSLVMGTASGIGMFMAPFMVKLLGKRNCSIITNLSVCAASIFIIIFPSSLVLLFIMTYVTFWAVAVQLITQPAMNADSLDYQQWKTGDRYEGMTGNLSMIGQLIAMGTNFIIPAIYEMYGVIDDYDILYDAAVREPMFRTLAIVAAVGGLLCAIPFIFWDLSEKKHSAIIEDLKVRAEAQNIKDGCAEASVLSSGEMLAGDESEELQEKVMNEMLEGNAGHPAEEQPVSDAPAEENAAGTSEDSTDKEDK